MARAALPLLPEEALLMRNFFAYIEARNGVAGHVGDVPTKGDTTIGGGCKFTRDGNIYRMQSCACKPGFHSPTPPIVDESAPPEIVIACEPDDTPSGPSDPGHPGAWGSSRTRRASVPARPRPRPSRNASVPGSSIRCGTTIPTTCRCSPAG